MAVADLETDEPETAEAGPGDSDDTLMQRLRRWERLARDHWSGWRDEARQCFDMVAGKQWSEDDKAALLEQMRQPVTFNRVAPMVDAVTGAEILNRQEVRYIPREQGDVQVNELITAADEWSREQADTEDEESDAFADVVICGLGWTETRMDYANDPEGRIVDERIDPMEMWALPNGALQRNLGNSRCLIRARYRDRDSLPKKWRSRLPTGASDSAMDDPAMGWTGPKDDYERDGGTTRKEGGAEKREVWVRHLQWWEEEPAWRIADPETGQAATLTKQQMLQLNKLYLQNGMKPPEAVQIEQRKYYQAVLCGSVFLEPKAEIEAGAFTFKCITGKRDRNANTFYGAVRAMIDPQMWGNKFFVQIMHILNTAAKGGLLYEANSFSNPRKALEDWAKPDAAIELSQGALSNPGGPRVQERVPKVFPQGTEKMMEFVHAMMPQTSGINMELLGLVERDQPGVLEMQRKKAGYAILAVFFDSLRRYRKEKGRVRLYMIQHYISDGRLVRIKGKDSTMQYVPLVKQKDTATYDVIVDEAPMSPNQTEQTWAMLQAMMPLLAKLEVPPEIWSVIIEHSPLPSSVSGKINELISKQAQQPPPPDPEMVKLHAGLEADKAKMAMQAEQAQMQAAMEQQRQAQEMAFEREKHELEKERTILDLQATREKNQLQTEATLAKLAIDAQASQQKQYVQAASDQQKLATQRATDEQSVAAARAKAAAAPKKKARA
jgi:hypothetical protein